MSAPRMFPLALLLFPALANAAGVLTAQCAPEVVTRGEEVRCTASVAPPESFVLSERRAVAFGHIYIDPLGEPHAAGELASWSGPAIVPTQVRFTARIAGVEQRASASFMVRPRNFPRVLLLDDQLSCKIDEHGKILADPPYTAPGASAERPLPAEGVFSHARLTLPPPDWDLADHGPDTNWYFVSGPVSKAATLQIWLSHALEPESDFFRAQHSLRSLPSKELELGLPCRQSELADLRKTIWESEGCAGNLKNSRVRLVQRLLAESLDVNSLIEDLTEPLEDAGAKQNRFTQRVAARMREIGDNALLDREALPPAPALRCQLRFPSRPPGAR